MKDAYLYSATFLQGLQVIDLGQAITEYQQAIAAGDQFGEAVSTAGEGFATDAIINTISLPLAGGGMATMFGLQANDFATSNSGSAAATQTLLAATGNAVPFVMADPTLSGSTAVLYPPSGSDGSLSQTPLQMTSADGKTTYQFVMGRAVALGTLTVTDASGASTSKHIAVLVGTGRSGPAASVASASLVSALAVVDVSGTYTPGATVQCGAAGLPGTPTSSPSPSPNCPQMIGFLQLPTTASDVTLNGNIALVATGANILLVNLANPSQPILAGQITGNFGSWLGLTDAGILVGTSPNSATGGVQIAAVGTVATIQDAFPFVVRIDQNSNSLDSVTVQYNIVGSVPPGTTGELDLTRDGQVVKSVPLGPVQQGNFTQNVPTGVLFNTPSMDVTATVSSGGQTTRPFDLTIENSGNPAQPQMVPPGPVATFSSLSPNKAASGASALQVTINGSGMDQISQVFIQGTDGTWTPVSTASNTATSAIITVPASLLMTAGFLEISPTQDAQYAIAFMAFTPGLPAPSTEPTLTVSSVAPVDVGQGGTIRLTGGPFVNGMNVVLGRSTTPGVVLPTTYISSAELDADLSGYIAAQDLFVAVLSADGSSLSEPVPVYSSYPYTEVDVSSNTPPDYPFSVVSATGLVWNGQNQTVTLQGAGLQPGMQLTFTNSQGTYTSTTEVPSPAADPLDPTGVPTSSWLSPVQVKVPDQVSHMPAFAWLVKLLSGSQIVTTSPPALQQPQLDYNVLLGGLSGFTAYFDQLTQKVVILQQHGRTFVGPLLQQRNYVELTKDQVTWSITTNPSPQPDNIPSALQEIAGPPDFPTPDPAAFYLRGVHLTTNQPVVVHLFAKYSTPASNLVFNQDINIKVISGKLTGHSDDDDALNNAADKLGVPPQFLASQGYYEGGFTTRNMTNFRYEPLTVDFKNFSGDNPKTTIEPNGLRYVADPVLAPYVINGHALSNSSAVAAPPFVNKADPGTPSTLGPSFTLAGPILATTGNPGNPIANPSARLTVTLTDPTGNPEAIRQVPSNPYAWMKGGPHCVSQSPCVPAPTYFGIQIPPYIGTGPNQPPTGNQFSLDYVSGQLTLGRQLQPGETLSVTYYPVSTNQITVQGNGGNANATGIKSAFSNLTFSPGQSLSDWAASNLNSSDVNYQFGNFLTGTDSEKAWVFSATNGVGSPGGHARPIAPLDGRFKGPTAQFYASASYGICQVLARTLTDKDYGPALKGAMADQTLFPTGTMFDALNLSNLTAGFSLGAAYTSESLVKIGPGAQCGIPNAAVLNCSTQQWERMWSSAFHLVDTNSSAVHYQGSINDIITRGVQHEPY